MPRSMLVTAMGLLVACVPGEIQAPPTEGLGRVCVRALPDAVIHLPMEDGRFITPKEDGALRCSQVHPGRVSVLLSHEDPEVVDLWIDVGETTLFEAPNRVYASHRATEALARVVFAGRCAVGPSCSKQKLSESLETLSGALHSIRERERQAARLVLASWPVPVSGIDVGSAWRDIDVEPLLAAAYPSSTVRSASAVGVPALRELERMCVEPVGPAADWSAQVRATMLLLLAEQGSDATRDRIREEVVTDYSLRSTVTGKRLVSQFPMTPELETESAMLAASIVTAVEVDPCSKKARWLLYFYSRQCPACTSATARLRDAVRDDPELGVVVVIDDAETEGPIESADVVEIDGAMREWFDRSQGGLITPYFIALKCSGQELEWTSSHDALKPIRADLDG